MPNYVNTGEQWGELYVLRGSFKGWGYQTEISGEGLAIRNPLELVVIFYNLVP